MTREAADLTVVVGADVSAGLLVSSSFGEVRRSRSPGAMSAGWMSAGAARSGAARSGAANVGAAVVDAAAVAGATIERVATVSPMQAAARRRPTAFANGSPSYQGAAVSAAAMGWAV